MKHEQAQSAVQTAQAELASLLAKRDAATRRGTEIAALKEGLAYAALTAGGPAKAQLNDLNREAVTLELEARDIASAVAGGRAKLAAAQAVVAAIEDAQRARARLANAEDIPALLQRFDAAVREVCETANIIRERFGEADERNNWLAIMGSLRRALQGPLFSGDTRLHAVVYPPANRRPATETLGPIAERLKRTLKAQITEADAKIGGRKRSAA